MGYTLQPLVSYLVLGALLQEPISSQDLQAPAHSGCLSIASLEPAPVKCVGPFCKPCPGSCKVKCGPHETIGSGYCGKGCQCCTQPTFPSCLNSSPCGKGGKCRYGNFCPKGEKQISGSCGHLTKACICCAPDKPVDPVCSGPCGKGGTCRIGNTCPKGEKVILGSCGDGIIKACRCCAPDVPIDEKPGGCPLFPVAPPPPGSSPFDRTDPASGCQGDMECPGAQKCCPMGVCCSNICTEPCDPKQPWCAGK